MGLKTTDSLALLGQSVYRFLKPWRTAPIFWEETYLELGAGQQFQRAGTVLLLLLLLAVGLNPLPNPRVPCCTLRLTQPNVPDSPTPESRRGES